MPENTQTKSKGISDSAAGTPFYVPGSEMLTAWHGNAFGHLGAAAMIPSLESGLSFFSDCREFTKGISEQFKENAKLAESNWQRISACKTPEDYTKVGAEVSQEAASQWSASNRKLAALSTEYVGRRFDAATKLASAALNGNKQP